MKLVFSQFVENDLDVIAASIAEDNPSRAVSFIQEIQVKVQSIAVNPLLYQLRPDIGDQARMVTVGRYAILFHIIGEVVRIERIVYGGRDLPSLLDQNGVN